MTLRCRHVQEITAELHDAGATSVAVTQQGKLLRIEWVLNGTSCHFTAPAHPRDEISAGNTGRQRARRVCREARVS